jgi:hypothetical protein
MLLHHGSRGHFFRTLSVAAGALGFVLDVFVLPLLFAAGASQVFALWHVASSFSNDQAGL